MSHRWLPPSLLGLAALGALGVAIWAFGQGVGWMAIVPFLALAAALALWKLPRAATYTFTLAAVAIAVPAIFLGDLWLYFLPSGLLALMAGALRLVTPDRGPAR